MLQRVLIIFTIASLMICLPTQAQLKKPMKEIKVPTHIIDRSVRSFITPTPPTIIRTPKTYSETISTFGISLQEPRVPLQIHPVEIKSSLLTPASQKQMEDTRRKLIEYEYKRRSILNHKFNPSTINLESNGNSTFPIESIAPNIIPTDNEWWVDYIGRIIEIQMMNLGIDRIQIDVEMEVDTVGYILQHYEYRLDAA